MKTARNPHPSGVVPINTIIGHEVLLNRSPSNLAMRNHAYLEKVAVRTRAYAPTPFLTRRPTASRKWSCQGAGAAAALFVVLTMLEAAHQGALSTERGDFVN